MSFDEEPDGDPHGECAAEIHRLQSALAAAEADRDRLRAALSVLLSHVTDIEVLGEWSALDINLSSGKKLRAKVDAAIANVRSVLRETYHG